MLLLPIETDVSFFQSSQLIPSPIQQLVMPEALTQFTRSDDGAILNMNVRLPGFSIWVHYLWLKSEIILHPFNTKDTWALHYWLANKIPAALKGSSVLTLEDCMLFYLAKMEHIAWPSFGDALSIHINMGPTCIPGIVNDIPGLKGLENLPSPATSTLINPRPFAINAVTHTLLKRILHCRYRGEVATVYQQRNCIDLYLQYLEQLAAPSRTIPLSSGHEKALHEIQRMIVLQPEMVPLPERLADQYGMPVHVLKDGFQREFHVSLFDFVMREKLHKAFRLIIQGGLSRRHIAEELGYSHEAFLNGDLKLRYGQHPLWLNDTK